MAALDQRVIWRQHARHPVTAVPWEGSYALFTSDPGGGIYAIKAVEDYGWQSVQGLTSKPGTSVTAVRWYSPAAGDVPSYEQFLLFATDVNGEVFTTSGTPYQGWAHWARVSDGASTPGSLVTASSARPDFSPFTLFMADSVGAIRETTSS